MEEKNEVKKKMTWGEVYGIAIHVGVFLIWGTAGLLPWVAMYVTERKFFMYLVIGVVFYLALSYNLFKSVVLSMESIDVKDSTTLSMITWFIAMCSSTIWLVMGACGLVEMLF